MNNTDYYLEFENRFRGSQEKIIDDLSIYNELIQIIIDNNISNKFIDIGCGRGEWLEKWKSKIPDAVGIETDSNMIRHCKGKGIKVIQGNAIEVLKEYPENSATLITIFHVIEHLENKKLLELLDLCYKVLTNKGVLIMETPSIDNLLVSTKSFYLDPTHINHINPEGLSFMLEKIGFHSARNYYIHPGPLVKDSHLKITRILNGVAQDLLVVAVKNKEMSNQIFDISTSWISKIKNAPTLLQTAVEYDLEHEKKLLDLKQKYDQMILINQEMIILKENLKYVIYIMKLIKFTLKPLVRLIRTIKKNCFKNLSKVFNILVKYKLVRILLSSKNILNLISIILKIFSRESYASTINNIKNKLNKYSERDFNSNMFNKKLTSHHNMSIKSQEYFLYLKDKLSKF